MKAPTRLRRLLPSSSKHALLTPGRNCWRTDLADDSGLLIDGRDYYRAFYHAACTAERYILISGWQFDSGVVLLRGDDAAAASGKLPLLLFLNDLCERKSELRIYMLAWDYSMLYGLDREWFQEWYFNWSTNDRLKFHYDRADFFDASHHQKFAVIDGAIGFVGGLDLCASRWDERDHRVENPLRRNSKGDRYRTFHDLQSYQTGPIVKHLSEMFRDRWHAVAGQELTLDDSPAASRHLPFTPTASIGPARMAISRTEVCTGTATRPKREIRQLFIDAIHAAERIIYIENQYCSSDALFHALVRRMRQRWRPKLQIILVIAKDAEAFLEQLSIGIAQSRIVRDLKKVSEKTGHSFGIYYPASTAPGAEELPTYVHSKLLLVDDRFLSVGSANMNNRSMGYDTELNVAWDDLPGSELSHALRNVRVDLLAEHTGLEGEARQRLAVPDGLVDYLNSLADARQGRLRHHPMRSLSEEYQWLTTFLPNGLPFDSEIALESTQQKGGDGESWLARAWTYLTGAACRSRSTAAPVAAATLREEKTS